MAEIERTEHGDSGRARAWTLRAVRARHDPVWTADGYVSDRWRPVSPVSGRLDAFQWQTPVAALPSDKAVAIEASPFEKAMLAPRRVEPPREPAIRRPTGLRWRRRRSPRRTIRRCCRLRSSRHRWELPPPRPTETVTVAAAPLFRARADIPTTIDRNASSIPAVIPIVRAPDDPGVDDGPLRDEFADQINPPQAQAGGWRGFLSRWGA